ncbi:hypothetical protein [Piscinibacter defluvii]|uniref:hypothetical protein n=1 Tax=Piscinibacter defluvii TaxID=1796922 RepID=UPI0013E3DF61|nr:hypothetical protein [Piscinibacter defluvii]
MKPSLLRRLVGIVASGTITYGLFSAVVSLAEPPAGVQSAKCDAGPSSTTLAVAVQSK